MGCSHVIRVWVCRGGEEGLGYVDRVGQWVVLMLLGCGCVEGERRGDG